MSFAHNSIESITIWRIQTDSIIQACKRHGLIILQNELRGMVSHFTILAMFRAVHACLLNIYILSVLQIVGHCS